MGSASSVPDVDNDCPCFLINGKYLVDCGYNVLSQLRKRGTDLSKIEYVIFTHMHHDHYIGLAGLLFFLIQSGQKDIGELTFLGPETMPEVLERTYSFLQLDRFFLHVKKPACRVLADGETFETEDLRIRVGVTCHPVVSRCYRMEEKSTRKVLAVTGDTAYQEDMAQLFDHADAILHDCTLGAIVLKDPAAARACGHSTVYEAIRLCERAGIPVLFPMHMNNAACADSIAAAQPKTKVKLCVPSLAEDYRLE